MGDCRLYQYNAFEFDFSYMDVIYMYHPLMGKKEMTDLYRTIMAKMKVGAVMIEVLIFDISKMIEEDKYVNSTYNENLELKEFNRTHAVVKKVGDNKFEHFISRYIGY